MVSRDRALLTESISEIFELDRRTGKATRYRGGWGTYQRDRAAARERAQVEREQALQRREQLLAAERETRRRAAASHSRAGTRSHDSDKQSREWVRMRAEEMAGRARKMGSRARRGEIPEAPWEDPALRLVLTRAQRRRAWVLALEGVLLRRGDWALGPLEFAVAQGDRILISGPNGSGKSTLLAALAGRIEPARGSRRVAPGAVIAQIGRCGRR